MIHRFVAHKQTDPQVKLLEDWEPMFLHDYNGTQNIFDSSSGTTKFMEVYDLTGNGYNQDVFDIASAPILSTHANGKKVAEFTGSQYFLPITFLDTRGTMIFQLDTGEIVSPTSYQFGSGPVLGTIWQADIGGTHYVKFGSSHSNLPDATITIASDSGTNFLNTKETVPAGMNLLSMTPGSTNGLAGFVLNETVMVTTGNSATLHTEYQLGKRMGAGNFFTGSVQKVAYFTPKTNAEIIEIQKLMLKF